MYEVAGYDGGRIGIRLGETKDPADARAFLARGLAGEADEQRERRAPAAHEPQVLVGAEQPGVHGALGVEPVEQRAQAGHHVIEVAAVEAEPPSLGELAGERDPAVHPDVGSSP